MKTWKRALALVLALVMALSLVALPSFAEGEEESAGLPNGVSIVSSGGSTEGTVGMEMSKTLQLNADGKTGTLTLEAYATGNSQVVQKNVPLGHRPGPGPVWLYGVYLQRKHKTSGRLEECGEELHQLCCRQV